MASTSASKALLPGDHYNFSFAPSSPPHLHQFPSASSSSVMGMLGTDDKAAAATSTVSSSIATEMGPLGPLSPYLLRTTDPMETDTGAAEDSQRRGPPSSDTPGGDCKSLCTRHQRMANGGTNLMLQKSIEDLPPHEQEIVNTVWSLFSSSPSKRRMLVLRGLLTIACPSQLRFLQEALTLEMRVDPLEVLPREVNLKIFRYLDAISLGRAAQVSKRWKGMADDDLLWRTMCEQHIERKCEKCGWGLPLLGERRRKARSAINALSTREQQLPPSQQQHHHHHAHSPVAGSSRSTGLIGEGSNSRPGSPMVIDGESSRPSKRAKTVSPAPSRSNSPPPMPSPGRARNAVPTTRPWKLVYCERLAIERNWRKGTCKSTTLSGHTDSVTCLQVAEDLPHPNFPVLMTGSWDRTVRIWNLETANEIGVLRGHTRGVRALQFDAVKLVTGSMDATVKIWNWRTGECLRTLHGHRDAVICIAYDQQLLVSGSADSTIRVWDFGTGEVATLRGHTEWVNSVAIWDSKAGCEPVSKDTSPGAPLTDPVKAKASNKGKFLFSASDDMTIRVWDLYTHECVRVLHGHVAQVQSLRVISQDDLAKSVAVVPPSASTSTSAPSTAAALRQAVAEDPESCSRGLASSSQGPPRPASIWHAAATHSTTVENELVPLAFESDKRPLLVTSSLDNTIKVWDVEAGTCVRTLFGHIEGVWDVALDKLRIVSGSHDRTLKIWDKDTGRCLHTLVGHTSAVTAVTLHDQYIVTGSDDATIRIWNFGETVPFASSG